MLGAVLVGSSATLLGVDAAATLGTGGDELRVAERAVRADAIADDRVLLADAAVDDQSCLPLSAHAMTRMIRMPTAWERLTGFSTIRR